MEGAAKETVIIVHGTWAAPQPGKGLWYQPVTGVVAAQPLFTAKLDAALQERRSPARCWAHCSQGDQIFQWSGANSWIARTRAASALGNYVAKLQKEGWRCHIVAHSHGGNIVVEALPQIMTAAGANGLLGKIVTLGTPFIDTMSPILKRVKRRARTLGIFSWIPFVVLPPFLAISISVMILYLVRIPITKILRLRRQHRRGGRPTMPRPLSFLGLDCQSAPAVEPRSHVDRDRRLAVHDHRSVSISR